MSHLFAEVPEALSNTLLIAERCNVDLSFKGYHLPDFPVPEGSQRRPTCATCARRGEEALWERGRQPAGPRTARL
jgi:DNA polymerase III subunit alpha